MPPATPRPASTVVVLRSGQSTLDVLLLRRSDKVAFMAGAFVFPGGRVDDDDRATARKLAPPDGGSPRFADLTVEEELAFRVAAIRELHEEAALRLPVDALIPLAHWVTPDIEIRRYDTRFFLAVMPEGQEARHDEGEMIDLRWLSPADAIDRCRAGEIMLPPPTWTTLRQLARFVSVDDAISWGRAKPIVRIQPQVFENAGRKMLTLPGDPLYPTLPGWDVPEETRFVLEEGAGWKPVRA
jgi:8-oxo-dGTP pyrophosphatase MutT (NUDIX family)